jgi:ABC-2 type transport system permease protein
MVRAQAALELRTLLRNGEQLLLILIVPVLLLFAFGRADLVSIGSGSRIDFIVPGILALAVMSTAFTSQAIGTGFERRYGVLKRLGAVLFPLTKFPASVRPVLRLLPADALADGLRSVLAHAGGLPVGDLLVLCAWAAAAITLTARTFRWE